VLQAPRVQLQNGLICTKERPTSVPTTREQCSPPFHWLQVGRARWETTEYQKTFLRNWLSFWRHATFGVPVSEGVDEIALGLTLRRRSDSVRFCRDF
jgi:hypothetical protein